MHTPVLSDNDEMRIVALAASLAAVLLAAGCTGEAGPKPTTTPAPTVTASTPSASPSPVVTPAALGQPVQVDGYTIAFTAPTDESARFPCTGCDTGVLITTVTLTVGQAPLDPGTIKVAASDSNFSEVGVTSLGEVVIPPGGTRTAEVQLHPEIAQLKKLIVLTITGSTGVVDCRQDSRP